MDLGLEEKAQDVREGFVGQLASEGGAHRTLRTSLPLPCAVVNRETGEA